MPRRDNESKLSGSSADNPIPAMPLDVINPGLSENEYEEINHAGERPSVKETRGSGSDSNSDTRRLENRENLLDKTEEDTFPASDPPSMTPMTGMGRASRDKDKDDQHQMTPEERAHLPNDFKENTVEQFKYGRRSEAARHHFDRSSRRLERGNPDVGEIDLGTIEADKPAQPDDHDHFDSADDDLESDGRH